MHEDINEAYREVMARCREEHTRSILSPHERDAAEARGVAWLKSCLSPEQLADYDPTRSFVVIGEHTGHRYRICWGTSQNIIRTEILENGRELPVKRLCFGPRGVPMAISCCSRRLRSKATRRLRCGLPAGHRCLSALPAEFT
jgi:hypothetical protein